MERSRIDLLKREQAGRVARQQLKRRFAQVAGIREGKWQLLGLEESDKIREASRSQFVPRHKETQESPEKIPLAAERQFPLELLSELSPPAGGGRCAVYVIFLDADVVGVLSMSLELFRGCWKALVALDHDGFVVVDAEFRNKLALQVIEGDTSRASLDIGAWGAKWGKAVARMSC